MVIGCKWGSNKQASFSEWLWELLPNYSYSTPGRRAMCTKLLVHSKEWCILCWSIVTLQKSNLRTHTGGHCRGVIRFYVRKAAPWLWLAVWHSATIAGSFANVRVLLSSLQVEKEGNQIDEYQPDQKNIYGCYERKSKDSFDRLAPTYFVILYIYQFTNTSRWYLSLWWLFIRSNLIRLFSYIFY